MGFSGALPGLALPETGRTPAEVGRGGLPAETGRDWLGLQATLVYLLPVFNMLTSKA